MQIFVILLIFLFCNFAGIACFYSIPAYATATQTPQKVLAQTMQLHQQETQYAQAKVAYANNPTPQQVEAIAKQVYTLAKAGYAPAQLSLGQFLRLGIGGVSQPTYARFWYLAAAKQQQPLACWQLALSYWHGTGGVQDFTQTITWFEATAKQPSPYKAKALWNATVLHWQANTHELRRMEHHWKQLALQPDAEAQSNLGVLYLNNPAKTKEAINYLRQASKAGNLVAKAYLGRWLSQQPVSINHTKPNPQTEGLLLLTHVAQQGLGIGEYFLGQYYFQKRFDPTYAQLAFKWLTVTKRQHPVLAAKVNPLLITLQGIITPTQRTALTANAHQYGATLPTPLPIMAHPPVTELNTALPAQFYTVDGYQFKPYTSWHSNVFL